MYHKSHFILALLRISGQEQRPALQEPKRGETEALTGRWGAGRILRQTVIHVVCGKLYSLSNSQVKNVLCVFFRLCVCRRTRSWPSVLTGRSWVTRNAQTRWDTSLCVCSLFVSWALINHTVMHPSILSHSKTNSGVFPLSSVSGWSDGDSLRSPTHRGMPWHLCALHKDTHTL